MKTFHVYLWSLQQELRPVHVNKSQRSEAKQSQHDLANVFFT